MNIDKDFMKVLASGDERIINEMVATSLPKHKEYDIAVKDPHEWGVWADTNPKDAITLLSQWVSQGKDVSGFASNYYPDLTPCETFPNALGFAIHLHLKRFKFRTFGDYMKPLHLYSTTPVRNNGRHNGNVQQGASAQQGAPIGQSVVNREDGTISAQSGDLQSQGNEELFNTYKQRMLTAIEGNNRTELASVYNEIMAKPELTSKQKAELKGVYSNAKSAIRNQQRADRQTSKGYVNMADRSWDRADKKYNKVSSNQTLTDLNEVKKLIRETMLAEMKKV